MTLWNEIVKTALLGTKRANLPSFTSKADNADAALETLLSQISQQEDDATTLLAFAGTIALHGQTGWQPARGPVSLHTPTVADLPICPDDIANQLASLFDGSKTGLLPEMLDALAQTKHRVPETLLPNLLRKGARQANLRPFILKIIGRRGQWLAGQNPEWRYAAQEIDSWVGLLNEWQTAVPNKRQALLRQLRLIQPERGRQILQHTWQSNSGLVRHQLIKILSINLSITDEPFLEMALDDRNHLVRRSAADLLAHLPKSRLSQRMMQHAAAVLSWTPEQKQAITVRLPDNLTPAIIRDGIPNTKKEDLPKLRARTLSQLVSRVPLSYWTEQWQVTAQQIAQAIKNSGWPRTLTSAFSTAAIRQKNEVWAVALLTANQFNAATGRLVGVLSANTCLTLMQQAAKQSPNLQRPNPLFYFLQYWKKPWTTELGLYWLDLIANHLRQTESSAPDPALHNLFKRFSHECPADCAETAVNKLTTLPDLSSSWQKTVQNLCQTLQLRRELLAKIAQLNQPPGGFTQNASQ